MSDYIDPDVVQAACMADLSRHRQEELPLSNVEKRGPSFDPRGNNSTAHISNATKGKLLKNWGNIQIDDEEARQVEGLRNEDARPWARKFTENLLASGNFSFNAPPPRAPQASTKKDNVSQRPVAKANPGPPARSALAQIQQTIWSQAKVDDGKRRAPAQKARVVIPSQGLPSTQLPPIPPVVTSKPSAPEPDRAPVLELRVTSEEVNLGPNVLFAGRTLITPGKEKANAFVAEFQAILNDENEAYLQLRTRGKEPRTLNVLDFQDPTMDDQFCLIVHEGTNYHLSLADPDSTGRFRELLVALRRAAEQYVSNHPPVVGEESHAASLVDSGVAPSDHFASVASEPAATADDYFSAAPSALTSTYAAMQVPEVASIGVSQGNQLIDLTGFEHVNNPNMTGPEPVTTSGMGIGDIANALIGLVEKVMATLKPTPETSGEVRQGVEEAALEFWTQNFVLGGHGPETKTHIVGLVHHMVALQTMSQMQGIRKGIFDSPESPRDPMQPSSILEAQMNSRIKYTAQDMKNLQGRAVPCPEEIKTTSYLPKPKPPGAGDLQATHVKSSDEARKQISGMARQRGWLTSVEKNAGVDSVGTLPAVTPNPVTPTITKTNANPTETADPTIAETNAKTIDVPPTPPQQLDADFDTTMGNSDFGPAQSPLKPSAKDYVPMASRNGAQGVSSHVFGDPRWLKPGGQSQAPSQAAASGKFPSLASGSGFPFLNCSNIEPAPTPAGRPRPRSDLKGLGASRYADKPVAFEGHFTGTL